MNYDELVRRASGLEPYEYQRRIASEGLPELLVVPTGCGKTMAVVLGWLFRRRYHPDGVVRNNTPRRLVYVLPQRVLVEQVAQVTRALFASLGLDDLDVVELMGGEGRDSGEWRLTPERDAVLVATQDMALSGALNRRYGASRWTWPIDFGLLNNDCAYVYDEVQLMGPGLPTSRQLAGLRTVLGTATGCTSTWMSATVDDAALGTIDNRDVGTRHVLPDDDRTGNLARRLGATRTIGRIEPAAKTYARDVAAALRGAHRTGTRTIAVCNTVDRAKDLARELRRGEVPVVLVHSRFRPHDRARHLDQALAEPVGQGVIVVTTQVLEAGVDITSETLFTEAALWSSVVQRAGRCNRDGSAGRPRLLWCVPPVALPYSDADVAATVELLAELDGQPVTTEELAARTPVPAIPVIHPMLRRRDLMDLFDTLPDLSGADIDVSRFIRDADDREISVAWREFGDEGPPSAEPMPGRRELCPVPISARKDVGDRRSWRYDHIEENWQRVRASDLKPGMVILIAAADGGYDPETGWDPKSTRPVAAVDDPASDLAKDTAVGADPLSEQRRHWLGLCRHLADVADEVTVIIGALGPPGLTEQHCVAAITAGRLHDIGKGHDVFQETLHGTIVDDAERAEASRHGPPWAKSAGTKRVLHSRKHFRHELASALALLGDAGRVALAGVAESDLVVYLVAAHHGRVRLGFRSLPDEQPDDPTARPVALGVVDGDVLPEVETPGATLPATDLDLAPMLLGSSADGRLSWAQRMLPLRDRVDLGPFRLGFLEAIVRMADWRASARSDHDRLEELS